MKKLETKYRNAELSPAELQELRNRIKSMSDYEIGEEMYQTWMNEKIDVTSVPDKQIDKIKAQIENSIKEEKSNGFDFSRIIQIAATILLPVFIILSCYLYYENRQIATKEMIVCTARGERASVTLPDGTAVSLNSESRLAYFPQTYNKKERKISFDGEGYFQIDKNKEVPFIIDAQGLQVKVLGTTFNLLVRKDHKTAELALEEGSVWLGATQSHKNVILHPKQKAILDQSTGNIFIIAEEDTQKISAWRHGNMIFRNTKFSEVIHTIEQSYNVRINITCKNCPTDTFTGTLPLTNLNEVLEVIEKSYHLKAQIKGKEIILTDI